MRFLRNFFCLLGVVAWTQSASAVELANYTFVTNLNPTSSDPALTATPFSGTGTGRSVNNYAYQFTQSSNSGYMQFTLTANDGQLLDLSNISFSYDFIQTGGTMSAVTGTIALVYSTDNFATSGTLIQSFNETSGAVISSGNSTFTLAGTLDLSAIPTTSSITFRFVFSNNSPGLDTSNYRYGIDSVIVSGSVVPEPSTYALLFSGLAMGLLFFRRAKTSRL